MAKCGQTAEEFIYNVFPAMVGALASEDAEAICQKNDLSFVELIRPFCQLDSGAHIRDPVSPSIVVPVKNWKIRVIDIQSSRPPKPLISGILKEVVSKSVSQVTLSSYPSVDKQRGSRTPWFEAYRDCFFQLIQPMQHEFLRDFLACILVVSTKHPDPMHAFAALSSRQSSIQNSGERAKASYYWFDQTTLKYYVLLHDVSDGDETKAEKVFLSMKSVYGSHTCFLLQINSRKKMFPQQTNEEKNSFSDPWSDYMYPFNDDALNVDENEVENEFKQVPSVGSNLKDIERKEQAIVNELESIEKEIAERPEAPQRSLSFNDPLTSMHYDTLDDDDGIGPISTPPAAEKPHIPVTHKLSERSQKMEEYKRSLRQFTYNVVTSVTKRPPNRKERGQCMTLVDMDKIKAFVYEFAVRGLLPHIEKLMRNLSEQIMNRKGIHKSLFNATKKWFGGGKTQGGTIGSNVTSASYQRDAAELHNRKLGDLAFLVQHYDLAYNSYHSAKREFNNDHAWLYFAGSLEMAAISAFLTPNNKSYPAHYFEACISTYLNTCRLPEYAARACLLSTETFKSRNRNIDAAMEFIKLTNEESDLRSALLLEQAAHCYLNFTPSMVRKYAFHMILAGHRFSKSGQRKHTLRCYVNALQVYQEKGWHLAEDHVNFVIGRQSFNLGNLADAQVALKCLLLYESQQNPSQQASHLREFLAVFKQHLESVKKNNLPDLPLPNINMQATRCLTYYRGQVTPPTPVSHTPSVSKRTRTVHAGVYTFQKNHSEVFVQKWADMEKQIVRSVTGELPYPFKPFAPCLSSRTQNRTAAIVACQEQLAFEVVFSNPLKIPLNLLKLTLLWEFTEDNEKEDPEGADEELKTINNMENDSIDWIDCEIIDNFHLKPAEEKPACLKLSVKKPGLLRIRGAKYVLSSVGVTSSLDEQTSLTINLQQEAALFAVGVHGMQEINVQGAVLNNTKQQKAMKTYDVDKRLEIEVIPELPLLEVTFNNLPVTLLSGEVQISQFTFKNVGQTPMKNLHLICSCPRSFAFNVNTSLTHEYNTSGVPFSPVANIDLLELSKECNGVVKIPLPDNKLCPGDEVTIPLSVYGNLTPGVHEVFFMFYYEPFESVKNIPYRLVQQMIRLQTLSTLNVTSSIQKSHCKMEDDLSSNQSHIFTLNIENRAQGSLSLRYGEFTLKGIACYSKLWNVTSLVQLPLEAYILRPGETCSLHLKTKRCTKTEDEDDKVAVSIISLDEENVNVSDAAFRLFLQSDENSSAIENSFALILQWETFFIDESFTRIVIRGQTHVACSREISHWIKQQISMGDEKVENTMIRSPVEGINLSYQYNAVNKHDFNKSSLCTVPITVQCSNLTATAAQIEIEALDSSEQMGSESVAESNSLNQVLWSGHRKKMIHVPPSSFSSITLDLLTSVGLYEIQSLNAWMIKKLENGSEERLKLNLPRAHYVCVEGV